ncbi:hypothetical protein ABZ901_12575 [Actinacidiphila alni]|uniref:hypothetical protein n=1 Tax=Actinacidiphila alni TaxID=380248 RepID=UPI0033F96999
MAAAQLRRSLTASLVRVAVLAALFALLFQCTVHPSSHPAKATATAADAARAGMRQLLSRQAAAVLHRDRPAFLGTVDPRATGYLTRQRKVFDDLADVPLAAWSYRLVATGAFPLPPAADGTGRTAAQVELRYRLTGFDTQPVSATYYLTFAHRDGRWYVAGDDDGTAAGKRSAVELWDQGPVTVVRGRYSLVLGSGPAAGLRRYADEADEAVPQVRHAWPDGWTGKVVVEVPGTLARMAALLGAEPADYRNFAAVTAGEAGGTATFHSDRVIINPEAFAGLSEFGRQTTLTHETTHVATRATTTANTPLWLSEGVADWTAYRTSGRTAREIAAELSTAVTAGRVPAALPTDADFHATDAAALSRAYEGGWLACRMVADQWSPARLTDLYRAVAAGGSLDSHLRTTLGLTLPAFTARWRAYLQQELA